MAAGRYELSPASQAAISKRRSELARIDSSSRKMYYRRYAELLNDNPSVHMAWKNYVHERGEGGDIAVFELWFRSEYPGRKLPKPRLDPSIKATGWASAAMLAIWAWTKSQEPPKGSV